MNDVKLPPNNNEAEESIIGSLLINGDTITLVENKIKPNDFYFEQNQWMYQSCLSLRSRREKIDQVTLAQELSRIGKLELCGGNAKLNYLLSIVPTSLDIEYYADIIYRLSVSRQLISLGDKVSRIGYEEEPDINKTMDELSNTFVDFRKSVITYNELYNPTDVANIVYDMADENKRPKKIASWGFRNLDKITGGIFPELIIIGARPSVGKTQLMLDVLQNIALQDKKALFCSCEMSIRSLMERKIARELKTDIKLLRKDSLDVDMKHYLTDLAGKISEEQVWYLPQGSSSQEIYNESLKLKDNIGLDIVFVDYLQILRDCWQSGKENKSVLVGRASKTLKSIVNDLNIPVVCASQLNRDIERRASDNIKPVLADLRESGDIEQDADIVFLLWRDMNNPQKEINNILEVKMAKNRQLGDAKVKTLVWLPREHKYVDGVDNDEE